MVVLCYIFPTLVLHKHTSSRQPPKTASFVAKSSVLSMPAPLAPCKMGTLGLHFLGLPWDCGGRLREAPSPAPGTESAPHKPSYHGSEDHIVCSSPGN